MHTTLVSEVLFLLCACVCTRISPLGSGKVDGCRVRLKTADLARLGRRGKTGTVYEHRGPEGGLLHMYIFRHFVDIEVTGNR